MSTIAIQNLSMNYAERNKSFTALENVSFTVNSGEFVSIIGSSGCGKSTLLSIVEGINKPSDGSIKIDGVEIEGTGKNRGVVFQHYSLFPWMTARKNIAFGIPGFQNNKLKAFSICSESMPENPITRLFSGIFESGKE